MQQRLKGEAGCEDVAWRIGSPLPVIRVTSALNSGFAWLLEAT